MKKIISLFQRNYDGDRLVRDEVVPGAEWVLAGEGMATQKIDGTCCLIRSGVYYKRYEVKPGATPPPLFEPANDVDEATGKQQGWLPVGDGPEDRWHREAVGPDGSTPWNQLPDGAYELCGPKVQGNFEGFPTHVLIPHGAGCGMLPWFPRTFEAIRSAFADQEWHGEGIVWWRNLDDPNCDKVKIKAKDFGLKRKKTAPLEQTSPAG